MELPPYRYPTFKGLLIHSWERTWEYIKKAGTIILAISIIIWAFMTFPGLSVEDEKFFANEKTTVTSKYNQNILDELGQDNNELSENAKLLQKELTLLDNSYNEQKLKSSFAGITGRAIENVTSLAGFDWKTNIALIGGVAAKEVIVSTMSTAYSLGNSEDTGSLSEVLKKDKSWTAAKSWSLLVFIIFYSPCFATIIMIVRETKSVYWGLFSFAFNTTIAFVLAVGVYQIMSFFC